MDIKRSTLFFNYLKKKYEADVQLFKPVETWMVRVHVRLGEIKGKQNEQVFIYYKLKKGELFWYDLNDDFKQGMAKAVANKLLES